MNDTFAALWKEHLTSCKKESFIDYTCAYPKFKFLDWLVQEIEVVLHGSCHSDIKELGPRKANAGSKNQSLKAVYATESGDESIFFAVLDYDAFKGVKDSRFSTDPGKGMYTISQKVLDKGPWTKGCVYILDRTLFLKRGYYWVSDTAVAPIARLMVCPQDFSHLECVETYEAHH